MQVWVPAGFHGACSGRSKLRNLASNHGVAFRGARAEQDNGTYVSKYNFRFFRPAAVSPASTTPVLLLCNVYFDATTVQLQPRFKLLPSVTAMSSAYAGVCDCVRVCHRTNILQQAAGTSVPGSTVRTQQSAVKLMQFFCAALCASVYQIVLQATFTSW